MVLLGVIFCSASSFGHHVILTRVHSLIYFIINSHYSLEEMAYIETLYGHQAAVTDIDCHRKERPISVSMDRTARAWKLAEDTHLIFRGSSKVSWADCVSVVKDDWFVTGHQDGNLCLWMTEKKKAVETVGLAHGQNGAVGRGIHSICGLKGSDLVATGSNDGYLRLWKVRLLHLIYMIVDI